MRGEDEHAPAKCKGIESCRSVLHNNECNRQPEKAVNKSVEGDTEVRRAEKEHKREIVEIENDDDECKIKRLRQNKSALQSEHAWAGGGHLADSLQLAATPRHIQSLMVL